MSTRFVHYIARFSFLVFGPCSLVPLVYGQTYDPYIDTTILQRIDHRLPPFRFHVEATLEPADSQSLPWRLLHDYQITVLDSSGHDSIQTISDPIDIPEWSRGGNMPGFDDANFDGFPDLFYVQFEGATGNEGYSFWLYDTTTHRFAYSDSFSQLCSPYIDHDSNEIKTVENCGGACRKCTTYVVRGNLPVPVSFLNIDFDRAAPETKPLHCIRGRIENGREIILEDWHAGWEVYDRPEVNPWKP